MFGDEALVERLKNGVLLLSCDHEVCCAHEICGTLLLYYCSIDEHELVHILGT